MAGANFVLDKAFTPASGAIGQFRAVKAVASQKDQMAIAGAGDLVIGITQDDSASADAAKQFTDVRIMGLSRAIAGTGGWTLGMRLCSDAAGGLIAATAATVKQNQVGIAMSVCSAGDQGTVLLTPGVQVDIA